MTNPARLAAILLAAASAAALPAHAQTPDQEKAWAEDRARAAAAAKLAAERLEHERAARKADPMAWARSLDPMTGGGWQFLSVAHDGSWAIFGSTHQLKRSGQLVTVWLRREYAEPQTSDGGPYLSAVDKSQFDCKKQLTRTLVVVYYAANDLQGSQQTEESDLKQTPWNPIIPGTRDEADAAWACGQAREGAR